jgi:hypothetical protein
MLAAIMGSSKTYNENELLESLKEESNKNCNHCYGRGFTGFIDEMIPQGHKKGQDKVSLKAKFYQPCHKCFRSDPDVLNIKL